MPMPEIRLGVAKTVSIAESLEIQKTASVRMKEAMAKQAADRLSKSQTKTEIGKSEMHSTFPFDQPISTGFPQKYMR